MSAFLAPNQRPAPRLRGSRLGSFRVGKMPAVVIGALLVVVILALALMFRVSPRSPSTGTGPRGGGGAPKTSAIEPTKTYENPFDSSTQYVNPFGEFKSPFQSLQQ